MQIIICDCGAELPFNERSLSAAAGKPFTCPICGKTRKLPLANVFAPAETLPDPAAARAPAFPFRSAGRFQIGSAIAFIALLLLAGPEQALRVTGLLIASTAAASLLVHSARRDPPRTMVTLVVALFSGLLLCNPHWSSTAGLAAIVIGIILQQIPKDRRTAEPPDATSEQWRLEIGKDQSE